MNKIDFKVALCGINLEYFDDSTTTINYGTFAKLIDDYSSKLPQIKKYESHLWKFGHCLYLDKSDFNKKQSLPYQRAIDLLETVIFLTDNIDLKIKISNKGHIAQSVSLDNPRYTKVLLDEVKEEIKSLEINTFWLNDNTREIIYDREKLSVDVSEITKYFFSLEDRASIETKIEQLKYWKEKEGENRRKKPVKKAVHMGIHALASLLRIDDFLEKRNIYNTIDDIKLSNKMCDFIASFLILFQIYDNKDFVESSKPYLNVRNLYRNPPKEAAPLLYKEIMDMKDTISRFRVVKLTP